MLSPFESPYLNPSQERQRTVPAFELVLDYNDELAVVDMFLSEIRKYGMVTNDTMVAVTAQENSIHAESHLDSPPSRFFYEQIGQYYYSAGQRSDTILNNSIYGATNSSGNHVPGLLEKSRQDSRHQFDLDRAFAYRKQFDRVTSLRPGQFSVSFMPYPEKTEAEFGAEFLRNQTMYDVEDRSAMLYGYYKHPDGRIELMSTILHDLKFEQIQQILEDFGVNINDIDQNNAVLYDFTQSNNNLDFEKTYLEFRKIAMLKTGHLAKEATYRDGSGSVLLLRQIAESIADTNLKSELATVLGNAITMVYNLPQNFRNAFQDILQNGTFSNREEALLVTRYLRYRESSINFVEAKPIELSHHQFDPRLAIELQGQGMSLEYATSIAIASKMTMKGCIGVFELAGDMSEDQGPTSQTVEQNHHAQCLACSAVMKVSGSSSGCELICEWCVQHELFRTFIYESGRSYDDILGFSKPDQKPKKDSAKKVLEEVSPVEVADMSDVLVLELV